MKPRGFHSRANSHRRRALLLRTQNQNVTEFQPQINSETNQTTSFFEECGGHKPISLVIYQTVTHSATIYTATQPSLTVGSSPDCDIHLDHPEISYRHALIQLIEGNLRCIDLASRQGLSWQGTVRNAGWISAESPVSLGPFTIGFHGDHSADPSPTPDNLQPPLPSLNVKFHDEVEVQHNNLETDKIILIGHSSTCGIRVNDPSVSKVHAALVRNHTGVWIVDLIGRGGVLVDGTPTQSIKLIENSLIQIGQISFTFNSDFRSSSDPKEETFHSHDTHSPNSDQQKFNEPRNRDHRPLSQQLVASSSSLPNISQIFQKTIWSHLMLLSRNIDSLRLISENLSKHNSGDQTLFLNRLDQLENSTQELKDLSHQILASTAASCEKESLPKDLVSVFNQDSSAHTYFLSCIDQLEIEHDSCWQEIEQLILNHSQSIVSD